MENLKKHFFDKNQYLGLRWEYPTVLNVPTLIIHILVILFLAAYIGLWLTHFALNIFPWPNFN